MKEKWITFVLLTLFLGLKDAIKYNIVIPESFRRFFRFANKLKAQYAYCRCLIAALECIYECKVSIMRCKVVFSSLLILSYNKTEIHVYLNEFIYASVIPTHPYLFINAFPNFLLQ